MANDNSPVKRQVGIAKKVGMYFINMVACIAVAVHKYAISTLG
jgi:hypothetical protein